MINKKNTVYLKFYVCTMLAFAIKDWWGSLVANFIKGPSFSPCISQGSARETEPVGHVWRDSLQGPGLCSCEDSLGKLEICREGAEAAIHRQAEFLLSGESLNFAFKLIESGPSRSSRMIFLP